MLGDYLAYLQAAGTPAPRAEHMPGWHELSRRALRVQAIHDALGLQGLLDPAEEDLLGDPTSPPQRELFRRVCALGQACPWILDHLRVPRSLPERLYQNDRSLGLLEQCGAELADLTAQGLRTIAADLTTANQQLRGALRDISSDSSLPAEVRGAAESYAATTAPVLSRKAPAPAPRPLPLQRHPPRGGVRLLLPPTAAPQAGPPPVDLPSPAQTRALIAELVQIGCGLGIPWSRVATRRSQPPPPQAPLIIEETALGEAAALALAFEDPWLGPVLLTRHPGGADPLHTLCGQLRGMAMLHQQTQLFHRANRVLLRAVGTAQRLLSDNLLALSTSLTRAQKEQMGPALQQVEDQLRKLTEQKSQAAKKGHKLKKAAAAVDRIIEK